LAAALSTLASYKEGTGEYLLRANPTYFRGCPLVGELAYLLVPQAQNVVALQQRATDAALSTDYDVARTFGQGPTYRALATPPFSIVRLVFNVDRPPFDRAEFRQALAWALDRGEIGARVVHGDVVVGSAGVVPPESPWYHQGVRQYPFDPDRCPGSIFIRDGEDLPPVPAKPGKRVDFCVEDWLHCRSARASAGRRTSLGCIGQRCRRLLGIAGGLRRARGAYLRARPLALAHATGTGADVVRSRAQLLAENALPLCWLPWSSVPTRVPPAGCAMLWKA